MSTLHKIIHVDMDAFYASVEQRDHPELRGLPVAVGGRPETRGAVAAASYEARQFGVHSATPSRLAQKLCPELIFVKPRFEVYRQVSAQIREIFDRYTDLVEPLSLDEAYLDVTENKRGLPFATLIAREIKQAIYAETQLTASAGVSINKFLAKVASGLDKPNGLVVIQPHEAAAFVEQLPIETFHGIGPATAAKMHRLAIYTGADLKQWSEAELVQQFGKVGQFYYRIARGQDDRPVNPNRLRKSISAETSFAVDLSDRPTMLRELEAIAQTLKQRLDDKKTSGRTLTLKVKFANYRQVTRSRTLPHTLITHEALSRLGRELLDTVDLTGQKVRLLGLGVSNLTPATAADTYVQLTLAL